jgi:hypothetical protein
MTSPSHPMTRVETRLMGASMVLFVLAPTSSLFGLYAVALALGSSWLAVTAALYVAGWARRRAIAAGCCCARCTASPAAGAPETTDQLVQRGIADIERWLAQRTPSP